MAEKKKGEGEPCVTGLIIHNNADTKSRCRFCKAAVVNKNPAKTIASMMPEKRKKQAPATKSEPERKKPVIRARDSRKLTNHSVFSILYRKVMERIGKTFNDCNPREKMIFDLEFIYMLVNSKGFLKKNLRDVYDNFGIGVTENPLLELNSVSTPIGKLSVRNLTKEESDTRKVLFSIVGNDNVERLYTTDITPHTLNYIDLTKWEHPVPVSAS